MFIKIIFKLGLLEGKIGGEGKRDSFQHLRREVISISLLQINIYTSVQNIV